MKTDKCNQSDMQDFIASVFELYKIQAPCVSHGADFKYLFGFIQEHTDPFIIAYI